MQPSREEKWVISVAGIGMFLSTLDSGIINVALPSLQEQFHAPLTSISWTISAYLLVLSGTIIIFGKLSDRYGHLRLFKWGLVVFAVSSALCGLSFNTGFLVAFRSIQGLGAAMLQASAIALVTTLIKRTRHGPALGTLSAIMAAGPIVGPTVAGLLLSIANWRWLFWINLPLCAFALWGCSNLKDPCELSKKPLNLAANLLLSFALFCSILTLTFWHSLKVGAPQLLGVLIALIILSLSLFFIWQKRASHPILPFAVFRNMDFSAALLSTLGFGAATAIVLMLPPFLLEQMGKLSPWQIGLVSFCMPLGAVISARSSGHFIKRWGGHRLMLAGLFTMMVSLIGLAFVQYRMGLLFFTLLLLIYGCGCGLFQPPSIAAVTGAVTNSEQGTASAINRMTHNFGNALGVAISANSLQLLSSAVSSNLEQAFFHAWLIALSFTCFSLIFSIRLKKISIANLF